MLLHTVSTSPFVSDALSIAISHAHEGDSVLLFADAVYAAVMGGTQSQQISAHSNLVWYAIDEDCDIRGITALMMTDCVKRISYSDFVALTLTAHKTIAW